MNSGIGRLRYASFLLLLIVCALSLAARLIYLFVADAERFPINTIQITASYQHISHQQIESVLANYLKFSFFSLPVRRLYADLTAINWANEVQIERVWPDILKIILVEKTPVALWNNKMVTEKGELFDDKETQMVPNLPHLSGPDNQQKKVLQVYQKMSKILSTYGLHAIYLEWSNNQDWQLTLANGWQLYLGKRDLELRVTRFCRAYPAVSPTAGHVATVDLRYPRGMAVQWRKEMRK